MDPAANPYTHQYQRVTKDVMTLNQLGEDVLTAFGAEIPYTSFKPFQAMILTYENFTYPGGDASTPVNMYSYLNVISSSSSRIIGKFMILLLIINIIIIYRVYQ